MGRGMIGWGIRIGLEVVPGLVAGEEGGLEGGEGRGFGGGVTRRASGSMGGSIMVTTATLRDSGSHAAAEISSLLRIAETKWDGMSLYYYHDSVAITCWDHFPDTRKRSSINNAGIHIRDLTFLPR